jgi:isoaspartyl peptidase/L-asparaginase-like protein (Ntn-hydrolase superfamily)
MENGKTAQKAVELGIRSVNRRLPVVCNSMGLIAIDTTGRIGVAHNSQNLCWAYITPEIEEPKASLVAKIVREHSN